MVTSTVTRDLKKITHYPLFSMTGLFCSAQNSVDKLNFIAIPTISYIKTL